MCWSNPIIHAVMILHLVMRQLQPYRVPEFFILRLIETPSVIKWSGSMCLVVIDKRRYIFSFAAGSVQVLCRDTGRASQMLWVNVAWFAVHHGIEWMRSMFSMVSRHFYMLFAETLFGTYFRRQGLGGAWCTYPNARVTESGFGRQVKRVCS